MASSTTDETPAANTSSMDTLALIPFPVKDEPSSPTEMSPPLLLMPPPPSHPTMALTMVPVLESDPTMAGAVNVNMPAPSSPSPRSPSLQSGAASETPSSFKPPMFAHGRKRGRPRKTTLYQSPSPLRLGTRVSLSNQQPTPPIYSTVTTPRMGVAAEPQQANNTPSNRRSFIYPPPPSYGNNQRETPLPPLPARTQPSQGLSSNINIEVLNVNAGEDIVWKIMSLTRNGGIDVISVQSASGTVSSATICQQASPGGTTILEGKFQIASLSGSFVQNEAGGQLRWSGGLFAVVMSSDGTLVGGSIAGLLVAASSVQVTVITRVATNRTETGETQAEQPPQQPPSSN